MPVCKDPALTYLNNDGYNVVRLPRAGIEPLDVLGRDGRSIDTLGALSEVWTSKEIIPIPSQLEPTAGIGGQKTQSLDLGIGLKLLADVLGGMGAAVGLPSLQLNYKASHAVEFKFTEVYSSRISAFALGKYLARGSLDLSNPVVQAYFGNDDTEEYVITEVLKSKSVSVTAKDDTGADVALELPAIQALVGSNVTVKTGSSSVAEVVYEGQTLLTFGFKAMQTFYADAGWRVKGLPAAGDLAFDLDTTGANSEDDASVLLSSGGMVRIKSRK